MSEPIKQFWSSADEAEPELTPREKALRDAFVKEYLTDYHPVRAAIRLGFKAGIAETYADKFMRESYVLKQISSTEQSNGNIDGIIKNSLIKEANYFGPGSSASARVSALAQLAKNEGIEKSPQTVVNTAVFHLSRENISKLDDSDLDDLVRIFGKMQVTLATVSEPDKVNPC